MNLLPHEAEFLEGDGFVIFSSESNHGYPVPVCGSRCERNSRPFACRIYPLYPLVTLDDGGIPRVNVIYNPRAKSSCPFAANEIVLNHRFVTAVRRAGKYLIRDEEILHYLLVASEDILESDKLRDHYNYYGITNNGNRLWVFQ